MATLSHLSFADLKAMQTDLNEQRKVLILSSQPERAIELESQINMISEEIQNRNNDTGALLKS